jgi:REP element-mobilizing transposase RayT
MVQKRFEKGIGNPGIYFITICSKNREKIFRNDNKSSVVEALASSINRNILFSNLKTGETSLKRERKYLENHL